MVYPSQLAAREVDAFMADLPRRYPNDDVVIVLDDPSLEQIMAPALSAAGWRETDSDMFLAHVGAVPQLQATLGLELTAVHEDNLDDFALTGLISFEDVEEMPDEKTLAAEIERRRQELAGTGRGLLAYFDGIPAGIMRWFDDPFDIWIRGLAVRPAYRGRGLGSALVQRRLADGYAAGQRSLLINVALKNDGALRLYRRLGFVDELYRRRQFQKE